MTDEDKVLLYETYNRNGVRVNDRVVVNNSIRFFAKVSNLKLDKKNKKVLATVIPTDDPQPRYASMVDVNDCYPTPSILYPGHHSE